MTIAAKLTTGVLAVALTVAAVAYYSIAALERASLKSLGEDLKSQAALAMNEIEDNIDGRMSQLQWYAEANSLAEQASLSSEAFDRVPDPDRESQIEVTDADWRAGKQTPFIQGLLDNEISSGLRQYADFLRQEFGYAVFAEMYVTNRQGAIIGASGRTGDYFQGDESWYQKMASAEEGRNSIGGVKYDRSSQSFAMDLIVALHDNHGHFVGILKGMLNIEDTRRIAQFIQAQPHHKTTRAYLVDRNGRAVFSGETADFQQRKGDVKLREYGEDLSQRKVVAEAIKAHDGWLVFPDDGQETFAVFSRSRGRDKHQGLAWSLIVEYDADEVLQHVLAAKRWLLLALMAVTGLAILGGVLLARSISTPIKRLTTAAAEIAQGNVSVHIEGTGGKDEIGVMARTFRKMTQNLVEANTELEQRQEELRKSEEKYRGLVETTSDFVWEVDHNRVFTYASPKVKDLLGYEPEEIIGQTPFDLMPADEAARVARLAEDIGEPGKPFKPFEVVHLHRDGRHVVLEISGLPILDANGNHLGSRGIGRDITQRKRVEEALRQSEEQHRRIFESVADCLFVLDFEGRVVEANPAACQTYGYTYEEMIGLHVEKLVHPDYLHLFEHFQRRVATGEQFRVESVDVRKDGSTLNVDVRGTKFKFNGKPHALTVLRDITERKQAEEALQKEQQNLRQMLAMHDRDRQLITYEIHDGLAQHLMGADMQLQAFGQSPDRNGEEASKCFDAGMRLLGQGVAEVRHLIGGLRPPILDESGVVAAIEHLVCDASPPDGPEIELVINVGFDRLEPLLENALFRIVQESLTNVRRHSKSDKVQISLTQQGDRVRVEIRDWGIGFDTETIKENCFGLGGMRERARLLGGEVVIDSTPHKGTHITVDLPLMEK